MADLIGALWLFFPVGVANMMPVVAMKLFGKGKPVNRHVFGAHKTWQGLVSGTLGGGFFFLLQQTVFPTQGVWFLGFAMGFGAILGDMVKSCFKRRAGIRPGRPWMPFDQLDFVIGGALFTFPFVALSAVEWLLVILIYGVLTVAVNRIAFALGVRKDPL